MPRFVILHHQMPPDSDRRSHWDLMLESGLVLRTWAFAEEPRQESTIAADALPDHRLAYLEYEGPVSDNRGFVRHWDGGEYRAIRFEENRVEVTLHGRRLTCRLRLDLEAGGDHGWTASLRPLR
jgi:hypothetical protein